MSEGAIPGYQGVGSRIVEDLVRKQRLANEAAHARQQEDARHHVENLMRKHRLADEAAHARQQEDARRHAEDLMRKHRLSVEASCAPPAASATTTSSPVTPRTPPPATAPGVHAVSDASSLLRVRNFLVLADAAAIALNVFRLRTDTLVSELGFDDRPHTDELFDGVLQGIAAPLEELNRVRDAVFTSDPRTVGLSFVSCLQDCYQSRGYTAERCEDPAYLATQTFVNLRGPIGPPGVNFGVVQEPDDGWNSWRAIYAADGKQLADYGRIRTQIIGLAGIHERDIISREQCFTLHPMCWPTRYTTSDLVRMAEESHRIVHDYPLTSVVPPASDVAVLELAPALPSPTHTEPALTDTPKGIPADEANVLVRDWLSANVKGDSGSITRDAVAAATGVSTGAVSKTAAWKAFRPRRDANSKPVLRTVPLTDAMLANIPADCDSEEIADLIKAQAEDAAADERQHPKKSRRHERRHGPS